jgi:hypothetical protein
VVEAYAAGTIELPRPPKNTDTKRGRCPAAGLSATHRQRTGCCVASVVPVTLSTAIAACLSRAARRILSRMGTKSRETIYGGSVRAAAERAAEARKEADRLAVEAWNKRMLGFQGPAQGLPDTKVGTSRRRSMMRQRRKRDSDRHEERLEEDFPVRVEE